MQRYDLNAAAAVLAKAGISSKTALAMLEKYPQCDEMLVIMEKAKLFGNDVAQNKMLFADLIHQIKYLTLEQPKKDSSSSNPKDSLSALQQLYQAFVIDNGAKCLLTKLVIKEITQELVPRHSVGEMLKVLQALQPLNEERVQRLFENTLFYLSLYKIIDGFDQTPASFLSVFNKVAAQDLDLFHAVLSQALRHGAKDWLNQERFKIVLDGGDKSRYEIITGFGYLAKANMLDDYRDLFLKNPRVSKGFFQLELNQLDDKEHLLLALNNPNYHKAHSICCNMGLSQQTRDETKVLLKVLLENPALTQAILRLEKIVTDGKPEGTKADLSKFKPDLLRLLECADHKVKHSLLSDALRLFAQQPKTLDECLADIKAKYTEVDATEELLYSPM